MNNVDLVKMLGNLSQSLFPVMSLVSGLAYLLGILFFMTAIGKLRNIGDARANSSSSEKMFVPIMFIIGGAVLVYLPSALQTFSNTLFGTGNILQYSTYQPYNINNSIGLLIKVVGLLWFIRGCVLLVHSSEPGVEHFKKGLAFLGAGILAMNLKETGAFLTEVMQQLQALT